MEKLNLDRGSFRISPSILSANFGKLAAEVGEVEAAGCEWIHVDVMDGVFVPNITIGPLVVKAIRPVTPLPLDCHLMVAEPEKWIEDFAKAGADIITVHAEATIHLHRLVAQIKQAGCAAGVSVNPATPLSVLDEILDDIDLVLIMSVNPGFGGQKFIPSSVEKVRKLSEVRGDRSFLIEVDGGVAAQNIGGLAAAGADAFVAGSAIFGNKDRNEAVQNLRNSLK